MENPVMYIFTYAEKLPKIVKKWITLYDDMVDETVDYIINRLDYTTCMGMFNYAYENQNGNDVIDCIIKVMPMFLEVPAMFTESLVIRCNARKLMGKDKSVSKIRARIMMVVMGYLTMKAKDYDPERFVLDVCCNDVWSEYGLPIRFPKRIDSKSIKDLSSLNEKYSVAIGYDIMMADPKSEIEFVCLLEDAFEDMDSNVVVYQNYNDIIGKLRKYFDDNRVKYRVYTEIDGFVMAIECTKKALRNAKLEGGWLITDMIG
jgi:hypothetical protein